MEKAKFEFPTIEIIEFEFEDVILTSNGNGQSDPGEKEEL